MTLRHLKVFVTVCLEGSITLAAQKLYVSQPSVSLTIKDLEAYYGVKLFERISKKLQITSEGQTLYEYASRIVTQFDNMNESLKKMKIGGSLYLGAGIAVGKLIMPRLVKDFMEAFPDIDVRVNIFSSDSIERLLSENSLDIAMLEDTVHAANLVQIPVETSPLVAISRFDHPLLQKDHVTLEELAQEKLLLRERFSHTRTSIDNAFAQHNLSVQPIWESVSALGLINAVGEGIGISILPLVYVKTFNNPNIRILNIDLSLSRQINIVYSKARILSTSAIEFIEYCKAIYQLS